MGVKFFAGAKQLHPTRPARVGARGLGGDVLTRPSGLGAGLAKYVETLRIEIGPPLILGSHGRVGRTVWTGAGNGLVGTHARTIPG
jgi:hypothetical protein